VSPLKYSRRPEPTVQVKRRALRPVLRWRAHDADAAELVLLPPVQLLDAGDTLLREPASEPERHDEDRVVSGGETLHRGDIQVIVVIVRDHDHVDGRKALEGHAGG
jgi:hypothetical protein